MAIFKPGALATDISGSIGGTTFSHNRGGMYVRNRSIPTNPKTDYQTNIREILAELSAQWRGLANKNAWTSWAQQNPVTNAIGAQITLTGHQAYVQLNSRIRQAGDSVITSPPIIAAPVALLTLSATTTTALGYATLTFTTTPLAATERLWIYVTLINSQGIVNVQNYLKMLQVSAKAESSPFLSTMLSSRVGSPVVGQVLHTRVSVYNSLSGLLSSPRATSFVVAA